ncbi:hypothetical protein D3C83_56320 [compost metagenome]
MAGDQTNLNDHGAWARVNRPTTRMSTPMSRIQSGMAIHTRPSGIPEENIIRVTDQVRREVKAQPRLFQVPGFFALVGSVVNGAPPSRRRKGVAYSLRPAYGAPGSV